MVPLAGTAVALGAPATPTAQALAAGMDGTAPGDLDAAAQDAADMDDFLAWSRTAPLDVLEETLVAWDMHEGGSPVPRPDRLDAYPALPEDAQRVAWQAWTLRALVAQARGEGPVSVMADAERSDPDMDAPPRTVHYDPDRAAAEPGDEDSGRPDEIAAQGMRGVWTLEEHGGPRVLLPADDAGATFLVTSQAVLRFDAPGAPASWMVKPGQLRAVDTTDIDGDGVQDLVIGTWSFWADEEDPSIVVVDGAEGEVLFSGLAGEDGLYSWTLSDVDDDGVEDLVGVDVQDRKVAYRLDGTAIYQEASQGDHREAGCVVLVCVFAYYLADVYAGFADVDGDGVEDHVTVDEARATLYAFIVYNGAKAPVLVAYSGTDASLLWRSPLRGSSGYFGIAAPMGGADATGDGREDVLVFRFTFMFTGFMVYAHMNERTLSVHDGDGGRLLYEGGSTYAGVLPVATVPVTQMPFHDIFIADLDGDGVDEFIIVDASGLMEAYDSGGGTGTVAFSAIRPGPTPWSEPEETYGFAMDLPVDEHTGFDLLVRDVDADGVDELVVFATSLGKDEDGNLTEVSSALYIGSPDGGSEQPLSSPLAYWDIDPATGNTYGWTLDDRWAPVDAEGRRVGPGMRMVVSAYPIAERDVDRDATPDFLVRQSFGVVWVNGRDGRLMDDLARPVTRYTMAVTEEPDGLHLLERDFVTDEYLLTPLGKDAPRWTHDRDSFKRAYISGFSDVTADGRTDLLLLDFREDEIVVFDPETGERVWKTDRFNDDSYRGVSLVDALPERTGDEIVLAESSYQRQSRTYALHVVEADAPVWQYDAEYGTRMWSVADGWMLFVGHNEGAVAYVVDATTGAENTTVALPADSEASGARLLDVLPGGNPELAVAYAVHDGRDTTQHALLHDFAAGVDIASFNLSAPRTMRMVYTSTDVLGNTETYTHTWTRASAWLSDVVGDWDGDGRNDVAFTEYGYPVVRSSRDGTVLAAAPSEGYIARAVDLNGDRIPEVAIRSDSGQLRVFRADRTVEAGSVVEDGPVRTVDAPAESTVEDDTFFEPADERVPAPAALLVVLALLGGLFVSRRRD